MATVTQTTKNLSIENQTFYDRNLLERLKGNLVFQKFAQKKKLPKHDGDNVSYRRFNALPVATTPLTEGVTPEGSSLTITEIKAKVEQYGDFVQFSDKIDIVGIDPVITEATEVLGEQAAETLDTVVRDVVCAGTNVQYAGGKANAGALTDADKLTSTETRKAVRTLKKNKAKPYDGKYYIGIVGADAEFDLQSDPLWIDVSKYSAAHQIFDGELGKLGKVRFVTANNTLIKADNVHCTMIIGKNAYGELDIEGSAKPKTIVKAAGSAGTADPLNQRSTVGWKAMLGTVRLEELAMVRIEHKVSA